MKTLVFLVVTSLLSKIFLADCHRHPALTSPYKGLNVTYKKVLSIHDLPQTPFSTLTHDRAIFVKQLQVSTHSQAMFIFQRLS
jgi:hypothetical protein